MKSRTQALRLLLVVITTVNGAPQLTTQTGPTNAGTPGSVQDAHPKLLCQPIPSQPSGSSQQLQPSTGCFVPTQQQTTDGSSSGSAPLSTTSERVPADVTVTPSPANATAHVNLNPSAPAAPVGNANLPGSVSDGASNLGTPGNTGSPSAAAGSAPVSGGPTAGNNCVALGKKCTVGGADCCAGFSCVSAHAGPNAESFCL